LGRFSVALRTVLTAFSAASVAVTVAAATTFWAEAPFLAALAAFPSRTSARVKASLSARVAVTTAVLATAASDAAVFATFAADFAALGTPGPAVAAAASLAALSASFTRV